MTAIIQRLRLGQRQCLDQRRWPAELGLRSAGVAMLGLCAWLWRAVCRLAEQAAPHPGTPLEFTIAAAGCVCLSLGLALTVEGAGLFRGVPLPPRALI